jgi:prepilin-type N-terminal cleavage/methylation domain-containing protein
MYKVLYKKHHGFTLIELLVVIAIIGILATVVLAGLGSQRERARESSAQSSARSVVPVATACVDANATTNIGADDSVPTPGTTVICSDPLVASDIWPNIATQGWAYHVSDGRATTGLFKFVACNPTGGASPTVCDVGDRGLVCTVNGCTVPTALVAADFNP